MTGHAVVIAGGDPTGLTSSLITEVELDKEPEWVLVTEQHVGHTSEPTLRDLGETPTAVYGTDYRIHSPTWISRFIDATGRRRPTGGRRVLLAADAAHVHSPVGGRASTSAYRMR